MSDLLVAELQRLIDMFLRCGRQDKDFVAEIEGLIIEGFQDEEWFDEVSEELSLFVPGGGTYYIDEADLARVLRRLSILLGVEEP